eukprot:g30734.t1
MQHGTRQRHTYYLTQPADKVSRSLVDVVASLQCEQKTKGLTAVCGIAMQHRLAAPIFPSAHCGDFTLYQKPPVGNVRPEFLFICAKLWPSLCLISPGWCVDPLAFMAESERDRPARAVPYVTPVAGSLAETLLTH